MGYIDSRSPDRYGVRLPEYQAREERIILRTQEIILDSSCAPVGQLFSKVLAYLGKERRLLAFDQQTKEAEHFGLMRNSLYTLQTVGVAMVTYLMKSYGEYGCALIDRLKSTPFPLSMGEIKFEAEVLSFEELKKRQWLDIDPEEYKQAFWSWAHNQNEDGFHRFSLLYHKAKFTGFLQQFQGSIFLGTLSLQGELNFPLTQYFARIHEDGWEGPLLFHMDFFYFKPMLEKVADLFGKCIQSNASDLESNMVRFCYFYTHVMPFSRGSALIREWLERAIYGVHNYKIKHSPEQSLDLEAFSSFSLEEFTPKYRKSISFL